MAHRRLDQSSNPPPHHSKILSKRFAELLGGDLSVVETETGVGSTFRATLSTGSLVGVEMLENPATRTGRSMSYSWTYRYP